MADAAVKKPSYPSKPCPKCKRFIHARSLTHPDCGWVMRKAKAAVASAAPKRKVGRPAGSAKARSISFADIEAIKSLTDRLGAKQVAELAKVLA